jgi:hypothetical protein
MGAARAALWVESSGTITVKARETWRLFSFVQFSTRLFHSAIYAGAPKSDQNEGILCNTSLPKASFSLGLVLFLA